MTDCELLELAAKAAGFHFHGVRVGSNYFNCYVSATGNTDDWFVWSPLTDDGDEARLEAALRLSVDWRRECVEVFSKDVSSAERYADHAGNRQAARRCAGVRAAAEIGKAMA